MKNEYISPQIVIIDLPSIDVITTSTIQEGDNNDGGGWGQIQGK